MYKQISLPPCHSANLTNQSLSDLIRMGGPGRGTCLEAALTGMKGTAIVPVSIFLPVAVSLPLFGSFMLGDIL